MLLICGSGGWDDVDEPKAEAEKFVLIRPVYWQAEAFGLCNDADADDRSRMCRSQR